MNSTVSKVDLFRIWQENDLDFDWIASRMRGDEAATDEQKAGLAFHKALESVACGEADDLIADGYRFVFVKDFELELPPLRELQTIKTYGELTLHGRVDGVQGLTVIDYKTTDQFDADRYMSSYLWRFYLDMMNAEVFRWLVFIIKELDEPKVYGVFDVHTLEQRRYPELAADCENVAREYATFLTRYVKTIYAPRPTLEDQLKASVEMVQAKKAAVMIGMETQQ